MTGCLPGDLTMPASVAGSINSLGDQGFWTGSSPPSKDRNPNTSPITAAAAKKLLRFISLLDSQPLESVTLFGAILEQETECAPANLRIML